MNFSRERTDAAKRVGEALATADNRALVKVAADHAWWVGLELAEVDPERALQFMRATLGAHEHVDALTGKIRPVVLKLLWESGAPLPEELARETAALC